MTTSTSPSGPLRLSDTGELIAAVPAMLGFHPERSVVVVSLSRVPGSRCEDRTDAVGAVMRHDLLLPADDEPVSAVMGEVFERFGAVCAQDGADAVLVILVDDRLTDPHGAAARGACRLVDRLADRLTATGIEIVGVHATTEIRRGQPWFVPGGAGCGVVADPDSSVVAATRVFRGGPIRRSRDDLTALLAPLPAGTRRRVADLVEDRIDARDLTYARDVRAGGTAHADRRELEELLRLIADRAAAPGPSDRGGPPESELRGYADMSVLLANPSVRDAVLGLSAGPTADTVEGVWIALARALPDPERAEAAALVGFSAYVRGDGPLAGVALAEALASDPRHRLSDLLDQALQAGLRPDAIRGLADTGRDIASRLGVALP